MSYPLHIRERSGQSYKQFTIVIKAPASYSSQISSQYLLKL